MSAYAEFTQSLPDSERLYLRVGIGKYATPTGVDSVGRHRDEVAMT